MWDINWSKISSCTLEERKKLIPYIFQLLDLRIKFEEKGINGFDEFIDSSSNLFEKVALHFIIQGYHPKICETSLFSILNSSNLENDQYLKDVIFAAFVLLIQKGGIATLELQTRLSVYLGIECVSELIDETKAHIERALSQYTKKAIKPF